jgi:hypothetical protein
MRKKRLQSRKGRKPDVVIPALPELAEHANAIRRIGKQTFEGAVEIGRRLVRCRELLKAQRVWLAWLRLEFGWSRKHADNLIHLHSGRDKVAKFATLGVPLSALYLLSQQPAKIVENIEHRTEPGKRPLVREIKEQVHRERAVIGMPAAADKAGALAAMKMEAAAISERRIRRTGKLGDQESRPERLLPAEQPPRPRINITDASSLPKQFTSPDLHRVAVEHFPDWLASVARGLAAFEPAAETAAALPAKHLRVDEDVDRIMRFLDEFRRVRRKAGAGKLKLV